MIPITRAEALVHLENKKTVLDKTGNPAKCIAPSAEYYLPKEAKVGDVYEHKAGGTYTVVMSGWKYYNLIDGTDLYAHQCMGMETLAEVLALHFKKPETESKMPAKGTRLRFLEDNFRSCAKSRKGGEVLVLYSDEEEFYTNRIDGVDGSYLFFSKWKEGLEIVDEVVEIPKELLPLPPAPEGKVWVGRGWGWESDKKRFGYRLNGGARWHIPYGSTNAIGNESLFYIELVQSAFL